eukprot:scaffold21432_cov72-Isochrysis_galbana.AAC.1
MFREVSSFPALPAKGDLLTPIEMDMVGCSTAMGVSGLGSFGSTSVSPMSKSSTPEKTTMSPADAPSTAFLPMASNTNSSEMRTLFTGSPGPAHSPMPLFLDTMPDLIQVREVTGKTSCGGARLVSGGAGEIELKDGMHGWREWPWGKRCPTHSHALQARRTPSDKTNAHAPGRTIASGAAPPLHQCPSPRPCITPPSPHA